MKEELGTTVHGTDQYLTFILHGEEYGLNILKVRGIQGWEKPTTIPGSPEYVVGLINLRGEVVPIIDLRKKFGLAANDYDARTVVIIVTVQQPDQERTVGLVVDAISEVYNTDPSDIKQSPDFGEDVDDKFIRGVVMIDEKMVILIEIDKLIDWGVLDDKYDQEEGESQGMDVAMESTG